MIDSLLTYVPDWPTTLSFAVATMIIALTPGPDMTLFVGRSIAEGRAAGLACAAGAMTGCLIHTTLVAVGLSALIVASPEAFLALRVAGAIYLVWLAWQAIAHGSAFRPETDSRRPRSLRRNWLTGVGVNLMNPKVILFFMTFLPQFVSASDPDAPGKLFFLGFLFIVLSVPVNFGLVFVAHGFAALLRRSPGVTRVIDWLFAGIFSAFAVKILMTQAR